MLTDGIAVRFEATICSDYLSAATCQRRRTLLVHDDIIQAPQGASEGPLMSGPAEA